MGRELVTKESLLAWIKDRLSRLEDCEKCDNPSKREPIAFHELRVATGSGVNWAAETPYYLCYHQCRASREKVIEEAANKFNVIWE